MDFKKFWLSMTVPQRDQFAKDCGTTANHLRNIAYYDDKIPSPELALAIERNSAGAVSLSEANKEFAADLRKSGYKRVA